MSGGLLFSFTQAGFVGKLVLLGLLFISVFAWSLIVQKYRQLKYAERKNKKFLQTFQDQSGSIFSLYNEIRLKKSSNMPYVELFKKGCVHVARAMGLEKTNPGVMTMSVQSDSLSVLDIENLEKSLQRVISEQVLELEKSTVFLATTAGISPLLGLFGTVWGVMNSFRSMAAQGSASIGTVAPGISEALITTVAGLFVAIPALVFYNWFRNRINEMTIRMENFAGEFVEVVSREFVQSKNNAAYTG